MTEDEAVKSIEASAVHVLTSIGIPHNRAAALTANVLHTLVINL